MKKWALSAILYFIVVVGSYYAYTAISDTPTNGVDHSNTEQHNQ